MEFNEKLQTLRKAKGLTQEELAQALFVSRTAISKWESGRGYPSIDSLKAIANFFCVTIDALLSGAEALNIAEEDTKQKQKHLQDLVFGLLDVSILLFFFLPIWGQTNNGSIQSVSLLALTGPQPWLIALYWATTFAMILSGFLLLALQTCGDSCWMQGKAKVSLVCNVIAVFLFICTRQPYAAAFAFALLVIKVLLLVKKQ